MTKAKGIFFPKPLKAIKSSWRVMLAALSLITGYGLQEI